MFVDFFVLFLFFFNVRFNKILIDGLFFMWDKSLKVKDCGIFLMMELLRMIVLRNCVFFLVVFVVLGNVL